MAFIPAYSQSTSYNIFSRSRVPSGKELAESPTGQTTVKIWCADKFFELVNLS